ncbi:MAG: SDR family NAD(P)-dependent oxidoreductase [Pseudomonadales bacterium]|nr:SDR family NAD(P)-dependent oxidoreductase [Pseudomonadales bacterium]
MSELVGFVTGAATGIGSATARQLAAKGLRVAVCDINRSVGAALADEIGGSFYECDVTNFASVQAAASACESELGTPTYVHLNAGIMTVPTDDPFLAIEDVTLDQFNSILGVNFTGVFHGMKVLLPKMKANGGAITTTASVAAFGQLPFDPLYSATKHALVGFVRSIAAANASGNVRINAICPGVVDTAIVPGMFRNPEMMMPPEELASEVVDLLYNGASGEIRAKVAGREAFEVPAIDVMTGEVPFLANS